MSQDVKIMLQKPVLNLHCKIYARLKLPNLQLFYLVSLESLSRSRPRLHVVTGLTDGRWGCGKISTHGRL